KTLILAKPVKKVFTSSNKHRLLRMPATQRAIFFRGSPAEELSYKAKRMPVTHQRIGHSKNYKFFLNLL
ncbi:MAG: hypothetical protein K6G30_00285, partial [Acetatifactor sp.]|nr:hypothetical protein [Acetatifactor sp.]